MKTWNPLMKQKPYILTWKKPSPFHAVFSEAVLKILLSVYYTMSTSVVS